MLTLYTICENIILQRLRYKRDKIMTQQIDRSEIKLEKLSQFGFTQKVKINRAKVIKATVVPKLINHYRVRELSKLVLVDEKLGTIFISGFANDLFRNKGALLSGIIELTGVGDATEQHPVPMLFARKVRGKLGTLKVEDSRFDESEAQFEFENTKKFNEFEAELEVNV